MRNVVARVVIALLSGAALVAGGLPAAPSVAAPADGRVLAASPVPAAQLPAAAARAVKIRYTTRSQSGRPAVADGVVYYPHGSAPAGGWKVVSWAHGTSGIVPACAPSGATGAEHDRLQPTISAALRRGYVVTASDYIGLSGTPGAEYLGGRSVAYNVIDMVRAARGNDAAIGPRWASLGHSQGGHAALWATRLADTYAPELRNVGTVAIAPASQIETVLPLVARPGIPDIGPLNRTALFALYTVDGLHNARPDLRATDILTPAGRHWLARARSACTAELNPELAEVPPGTLFARPLGDGRLGRALREYTAIPATGWSGVRPIRLQQGMTDVIVSAPTTAALAAQLTGGGARVSVGTYGGDHMGVLGESMRDTYDTVDRLFG